MHPQKQTKRQIPCFAQHIANSGRSISTKQDREHLQSSHSDPTTRYQERVNVYICIYDN